METPDEVIHQPIRLRMMAALTACGAEDEGLDFTRLKNVTGATDGAGGVRRGQQGLRRGPSAHHGQGEPRGPRRLRASRGVAEGDHRRRVRFAIGAATEIRQCRRVSPLERRSRIRCFDF
jgi:hypothetical protein